MIQRNWILAVLLAFSLFTSLAFTQASGGSSDTSKGDTTTTTTTNKKKSHKKGGSKKSGKQGKCPPNCPGSAPPK